MLSKASKLTSSLKLNQLCRSFSSGIESLVRTEIIDGIAVLRLSDPQRLNAMTVELGEAFSEEVNKLRQLAATQEIRACVLTGEGRAFSAGGDLAFLDDRAKGTPFRNQITMRGYYSLFLCLRDLAVPIVASINGPAVGAGLAVALAADVRVASVSSYLGFPFAKLGIHPGMGSSLLLARVVGHERAAHMFLTGEFYSSAQAKEAGLVMEVVGAAAAEAATEAAQQESATETETKAAAGMAAADATFIRAMQIATSMARNSPSAIRCTLDTLRSRKFEGIDEALCREADAQALNYAEQDFTVGLAAVKAKNPRPDFKGW